jgi:toxin ParE1/3/4
VKNLRIHESARQEAHLAALWYAERSVDLARGLIEELLLAISKAHRSPDRYPLYLHGTRRVIIDRFPYSIIYLNWQDEVFIVAMAHAKRRPAYWNNRI